MADEQIGKPFTRVYRVPDELRTDSMKFRRRLSAHVWALNDNLQNRIREHLEVEHGIVLPVGPNYYDWRSFFTESDFGEVLDSITGIYNCMRKYGYQSDAPNWKKFIGRARDEESVGYRLDDQCGVHFRIDEHFEHTRLATLNGLGKHRYAAARQAFESGTGALDGASPDTLTAVRGVFEACEEVFKLMLGGKANRLTRGHSDNYLKPLVETLYSGRDWAVAERMLSAFADWVDGMHNYRHAQGVPDPSPPPLELAVAIIDSGAAYLRWLIEIDTKASLT
jgi:hypothetical protein